MIDIYNVYDSDDKYISYMYVNSNNNVNISLKKSITQELYDMNKSNKLETLCTALLITIILREPL